MSMCSAGARTDGRAGGQAAGDAVCGAGHAGGGGD